MAGVVYRERMLRFRPRVGPFVWTPGPRRPRVPSMPGITFAVTAIFVLGIPAGVFLAWWISS